MANGTSELKESDKPLDKAELLDRRLRAADAERWEWALEVRRAWQYYQSQQWQDLSAGERSRVIPVTANIIRRDVDQLVSQVLDADPIINPKGRHARDYELGKLLIDVLQWSRDEEKNWFNDLEDVITDCFHVGEGILMETWNVEGDDGLGMPEATWVDPRFIVWDPAARNFQRGDAEWMIHFKPLKVDYLESKWKKQLEGHEIESDVPDLLMSGFDSNDRHSSYGSRWQELRRDVGQHASEGGEDYQTLEPQAYEKTMWEKRIKFEALYLEADTGRVAMVPDPETGEMLPMSDEDYKALGKEEQKAILVSQREIEELWETVTINKKVVKSEISIYDKSKGGHGEYPYAFFTYVRLRDRTHGKGEIDFLIGLQDLTNRTLARWLEQLMIAGSSFVSAPRGSLSSEDQEKLRNVGRHPLQLIQPYPGFEAPEVRGGNPVGANLFVGGYQLLSDIKDRVSGVYDVQRGDMPYQTSGKGIRALQSQTDLLGVGPRRHIESGLKQATVLRLGNILQFMRGNRIAEVVDTGNKEDKTIYLGNSLGEILAENYREVTFATDPETGQPMLDPQTGEPLALADRETGEPANVIVLTDETRDGVDLKRIEFELDTGKERNRQERMEFAREMLQVGGPALIGWAMELMDAPNKEQAMEALERTQTGQQIMSQIDELAQKHNIDAGQILEMIMQQIQGALQPEPPGGPQGPPQGPGGPPPGGMPPGPPMAPNGAPSPEMMQGAGVI